ELLLSQLVLLLGDFSEDPRVLNGNRDLLRNLVQETEVVRAEPVFPARPQREYSNDSSASLQRYVRERPDPEVIEPFPDDLLEGEDSRLTRLVGVHGRSLLVGRGLVPFLDLDRSVGEVQGVNAQLAVVLTGQIDAHAIASHHPSDMRGDLAKDLPEV